MQEDVIFESKTRTGQILFYSLAGVGLGCASMYFVGEAIVKDEYVQLIPLLEGILFAVMTIGMFFIVSIQDTIKLSQGCIEVFGVSGGLKKTIMLNTVSSWVENVVKGNKKSLTIFMEGDKYRIGNLEAGDYEFLKERIIPGKPRVELPVNEKYAVVVYFVFLIIGFSLLIYCFDQYLNKDVKLLPKDLVTLSSVILNKPQISSTGGRNPRNYIWIVLNKYQQFFFLDEYAAYKVTKTASYVDNVRRGDSLYIDILADDYQKKITKEKPLDFFDKTINYRNINIYGLRSSESNYLSLDDYNSTNKLDGRFTLPLICGLAAIIYAIALFVKNYRKMAS